MLSSVHKFRVVEFVALLLKVTTKPYEVIEKTGQWVFCHVQMWLRTLDLIAKSLEDTVMDADLSE